MTLAVFLFSFSFLFFTSSGGVPQDSTAVQQSTAATAAQEQSGQETQTPPASEKQAPAAPKSPATTQKIQRSRHRKRVMPPDCKPAPANGAAATAADSAGSSTNTPTTKPADNTPSGAAAPTAANAPSTECPPSKIVVRQGSTTEPAIQLAGGPAGTPVRDTANRMLQSAEENLKKISAQPLNTNQQDMVTQVRKFMDQSKTATAAGDLERARTLAWKAQTLSEELANPPK